MTKGELTRLRIVESAMVLIGKKGFFEVTLEEIAKHSKVQRQGIINYFGGKIGLFRACVLQILSDFASEHARQSKPSNSALDQLNLQFKLNLEMAIHQKERSSLILFLYLHAPYEEELLAIYQESIINVRSRYQTMIEAGIREGLFKPQKNPELIGSLFHEIIVGMIIHLLAQNSRASEVKSVKAKWDFAINSILVDES